jgi:hypothetical protein
MGFSKPELEREVVKEVFCLSKSSWGGGDDVTYLEYIASGRRVEVPLSIPHNPAPSQA